MPKKKIKKEIDDIEFLEMDEDATASLDAKLKKLKTELKKCQKERGEYLLGWQRAKADFINARKEEEERYSKTRSFAKEDILIQMLPVIDSFEIAFKDKKAWESTPLNWRVGIEHIYSQFIKILKDNGFLQVKPLGEKFNPLHHESIETVSAKSSKEDGVIVEVRQSGYILNDKIIRAPMVVVAQFKK